MCPNVPMWCKKSECIILEREPQQLRDGVDIAFSEDAHLMRIQGFNADREGRGDDRGLFPGHQ